MSTGIIRLGGCFKFVLTSFVFATMLFFATNQNTFAISNPPFMDNQAKGMIDPARPVTDDSSEVSVQAKKIEKNSIDILKRFAVSFNPSSEKIQLSKLLPPNTLVNAFNINVEESMKYLYLIYLKYYNYCLDNKKDNFNVWDVFNDPAEVQFLYEFMLASGNIADRCILKSDRILNYLIKNEAYRYNQFLRTLIEEVQTKRFNLRQQSMN